MLPLASRFTYHSLWLLLVAFINSGRGYFSYATTTKIWIGIDLEIIFLVDFWVSAWGL